MNDQANSPIHWIEQGGLLIPDAELTGMVNRPSVCHVGNLAFVGGAPNIAITVSFEETQATYSKIDEMDRLSMDHNLSEGDLDENLFLKDANHPLFPPAQSLRSAIIFSLSCLRASLEEDTINRVKRCVKYDLAVNASAGFGSLGFLKLVADRFFLRALSQQSLPAGAVTGSTALNVLALLQISAVYELE